MVWPGWLLPVATGLRAAQGTQGLRHGLFSLSLRQTSVTQACERRAVSSGHNSPRESLCPQSPH